MGLKKLFKKSLKIGGVMGSLGKVGGLMLSPEAMTLATMSNKKVLGARGSARDIGQSVDNSKEKRKRGADILYRTAEAAAAASAAAEEAPFTAAKESQRQALLRKGRRSSILTSSQGAPDPLGIPG